VSRIFDALQRQETERSGDDSSALPPGPDLLRRAERRIVARWDADGPGPESIAAMSTEVSVLADIAAAPGVLPESGIADERSIIERSTFLEKFPTLPISLAAQSRLVCLTDRENPTAEAIRLLGVRLRDLRQSRPLKKVLITSTIPQEGKSTISANLACALAQSSGEKVLLIEGDLRRPSALRMFGIDSVQGICEFAGEKGSQFAHIYRLKDAGFWILPAGRCSGNPIELLQSQKLKAFMEQITAYFDWIIIDSPPVLPLADTSIWMRMADGVLLITRQGTTQKHQLQKGLEMLDQRKLLGALLNGSMASAYSGYYDTPTIST
jgi:capsular exopolysaccharide synthesis family protein